MANFSTTPPTQPASALSPLALITGSARNRASQAGAGFAQAMQREAQGALALAASASAKRATGSSSPAASGSHATASSGNRSAASSGTGNAGSSGTRSAASSGANNAASSGTRSADSSGASTAASANASSAGAPEPGANTAAAETTPSGPSGEPATAVGVDSRPPPPLPANRERGHVAADGAAVGADAAPADLVPAADEGLPLARPADALHRWRPGAADDKPGMSGTLPLKPDLEDAALVDSDRLDTTADLAARRPKRAGPGDAAVTGLPGRHAVADPLLPKPVAADTDGQVGDALGATVDDKTALDGAIDPALLASLMHAEALQKQALTAQRADASRAQTSAAAAAANAELPGAAAATLAQAGLVRGELRNGRAGRGEGAEQTGPTGGLTDPLAAPTEGAGAMLAADGIRQPDAANANAAPVAGAGAGTAAGAQFAQALAQANGGQGRGTAQDQLPGGAAGANQNAGATALAAAGVGGLAGQAPAQAATANNLAPAAQVLAERHVSVPMGQLGFGQSLGAQVSMLARDGIQQARLHLNPADMGPITVQIAMEGNAAKVSFQADVAATRAALEASLPALAGALQEAGLTLTGGGVSQQSPQGGHAQTGSGQPGQPGQRPQTQRAAQDDNADMLSLGRSGPSAQARGLVDLVA